MRRAPVYAAACLRCRDGARLLLSRPRSSRALRERASPRAEQPCRLLERSCAAGGVRASSGVWISAPRIAAGLASAAGCCISTGARSAAADLLASRRRGRVSRSLSGSGSPARLESAVALGVALCRRLRSRAGVSRPGLTKDGEPHSLQVHDGVGSGWPLVLGDRGVCGRVLDLRTSGRPLSERWRVLVGRAGVIAAGAAVVVGIVGPRRRGNHALTGSGTSSTSPRLAHCSERAGHLGRSRRRALELWQEPGSRGARIPVLGTGGGEFDLTHRKLRGRDGRDGAAQLPLQF